MVVTSSNKSVSKYRPLRWWIMFNGAQVLSNCIFLVASAYIFFLFFSRDELYGETNQFAHNPSTKISTIQPFFLHLVSCLLYEILMYCYEGLVWIIFRKKLLSEKYLKKKGEFVGMFASSCSSKVAVLRIFVLNIWHGVISHVLSDASHQLHVT